MPLPAISRRMHSVLDCTCVSVSVRDYTKSIWTQYLSNGLWEFQQIYNLGAVWGQR